MTPQELEDLKKAIATLRKELFLTKDDVDKRLKAQEAELARKASRDELNELEKRLLAKLEELAAAMNKLKGKTEKAFKALDDKIKKLSDKLAILSASPSPERGEDAMFARKPLEGWSCASCDKNLVNLQGIPAEYYPWKKMPKKGDGERVPMVTIVTSH